MNKNILSSEKIHELGIKWVYRNIKDEYEILSVNINMEENPQIIARKNDKLHFIIVKTSTYPDLGSITAFSCEEMIKHADKHSATLLFASVGIANADTNNKEDMDKPQEDGNYYFNFPGLDFKPNIL